jgi:hypothetical protein
VGGVKTSGKGLFACPEHEKTRRKVIANKPEMRHNTLNYMVLEKMSGKSRRSL